MYTVLFRASEKKLTALPLSLKTVKSNDATATAKYI